jgi:hypothetical protein
LTLGNDRGAWIDRLARSLADGGISRREAVKRGGAMLAGGALLGVGPALDSVANAESLLRRRKHCPHGHASCGTKCCPTNEICVTHTHKHKRKPTHVCTCAHPHTNCSGHCTTLVSDPSNCGNCGHHCPSGTVCSHGTCVTTCHTGLTACGASCVNLATDPNNCGSCGKACAAGDTCVNAVCTAPAAPTCTDGIQNGQETDVDCGGPVCPKCATGKKCLANSDCVNGVCHQGICQAPTCTDGVQNEGETDVDCGGPNCPPCPVGKHCIGGSDCVTAAAGSCQEVVCQATVCTSVADNTNLPANQDACHTGACTSGTPGQTPDAFGTVCGANQECDGNGNCKSINGQACAGAATCLNGHCEQGHCCGTLCSGECQTCASGTCSPVVEGTACSTGVCNATGQCVQCNNAADCPATANVNSTACQSNMCVITSCSSGFADCDRIYSDGCEVNTTTSAQNCGMCGLACPNGQSCVSSTCS